MDPILPASDHDLLIGLKTTVEFIRSDLRDLKDTFLHRVSVLERDKVSRVEDIKARSDITAAQLDHETRIRALEKGIDSLITQTATFQTKVMTWGTALLIFMGIVEAMIQVLIKIFIR